MACALAPKNCYMMMNRAQSREREHMWSDQKKLTQAADDIVWEGDGPEDAFPPARRLMFAAMRKAITLFHVWEVHLWARAKA